MFQIRNLRSKIKSDFVFYFISIFLISGISFLLGRISIIAKQKPLIEIIKDTQKFTRVREGSENVVRHIKQEPLKQEVYFVASKNSTYYHWPWSPQAKRIKEKNKITFKTEQEARVAGFKRSASFEDYMPSWYQE